jgi:hypothetical protein
VVGGNGMNLRPPPPTAAIAILDGLFGSVKIKTYGEKDGSWISMNSGEMWIIGGRFFRDTCAVLSASRKRLGGKKEGGRFDSRIAAHIPGFNRAFT